MLIGEFDDLLLARPFTPFDIVTADGRTLRVSSPEVAWHPPHSTRTVWVAKGESGWASLVDLHHVTQVIIGSRPRSNGRRRRR